jgi:hypothetical protein
VRGAARSARRFDEQDCSLASLVDVVARAGFRAEQPDARFVAHPTIVLPVS